MKKNFLLFLDDHRQIKVCGSVGGVVGGGGIVVLCHGY
jgi:hypothetical protein